MPSSNLPSSFASAAAGQNAGRDTRGARADGRGATGGDWSRREGRSTNGTLTFRRSSTTPTLGQSSQPPPPLENTVQPSNDAAPAQALNMGSGPSRYEKDQLLGIYAPSQPVEASSHLFVSGWNPDQANGNMTRNWGKSNDNYVPQEPGACWDSSGDTLPIGLQQLSIDEKEAFSTDINSPLKPPTQTKETHQAAPNGRKASLSQGAGNAFGVASPSSATRPGTRRRETVDSNPFSNAGLASPTATSRFNRGDESPWFARKAGDSRGQDVEEPEAESLSREPPPRLPYGNLTRSVTAGSSGASMWSSTTPTTPGGGFGNFAIGGGASVIGDKRVGSTAGGSRLAHLIPKDSTDVSSPKAVETPNPLNQQSWRSRPRTDTDPFGDDVPTGSAALGGAQDSSPSMPEQVGRIGTLSTPVKGTAGDFGMSNLGLGGDGDGNGGNSPSGTNPYRSPLNDRSEHDDGDRPGAERVAQHEPLPGFSAVSRGFPTSALEGSDRSQTSSVGAKGFPLPGVAGWPGAPGGPSTGTPDRERANFSHAFGNSLFNPMGELQSPGLGNLGSVFGPAGTGAIGTGSIGRGSKMGSLFPAAMQAQMHSHEQESSVGMSEAATDLRQSNPLGAIGRGNFPPPTRDTESPMRSNRGVFEELFPTADMPPRTHAGPFGASEGTVPAGLPGAQSYTPVSAGGLPFTSGQSNADSSAGHMRQMVMPDRMRWVYLDPQSQIQGPFTGLEMNDWYKANFFTPDLRVKKVEDHDFEPLGQLIRRIGNSREPFLVPQIGVPHGPPPQPGPFAPASSGVVPPLSGVFPSFGRTLTAEEQNNLERRKQEEQYMMAQQREFMMRQQAMTKFPLPAQGLQHHSSAHSLQSQPSFGSMTSPVGAQPHQQPMSGLAGTGFFETAIGAPGSGHGAAGASSGNIDPYTQDELSNLTMSERQMLAKIDHMDDSHQAQGSTGEDITGHSGLPDPDQLEEDPEGFHERLRQFNDLRAQHDAEQSGQAVEQADAAHPDATVSNESNDARSKPSAGKAARAAKKKALEEASLSLTQQVQQAQAAAAAAAHQVEEPDMPMPFPPPSSSTPLPAPMAQRVRSNLPEQYSRSQTGTPDASNAAQPPPLAPWAKESSVEAQRGPSLKEIQESEARKARKAAETAQALRRAAMEQEVASLREKEKLAEAAAGLPASSTWAHGSPVSPASPWTKPSAVKGPAPGLPGPAPSSNKKTLAEIQREEELRKQKATSRDSPLTAPAPVANASKSYANLAGKPGQPPIPNAATAAATTQPPAPGWSTVGAGGKVKIPTGPSAASRVVSSPVTKPTVSIPPVKAVSRSAVTGVKSNENLAMDEFNKWVHRELSRGITGVNDIANFQATLDILPLDTGIIADAVYANSKTMDGRHFADEFVRRKKLAEKGVVIDKQPSSAVDPKASASGTGGWSEVAKKGGPAGPSAPTPGKEADQGMQGAGFKVVPSRKKNKK